MQHLESKEGEETMSMIEESVSIKTTSKTSKYLIFVIRKNETSELKLGVDAKYVVEILNNYSVTYLPMMPEYVRGVFNMRGQIIPVMDLRLRLNKPVGEKSLLVVLNYEGMELGIQVDSVDRMVDIEEDTITTIQSQEYQRFVSGMCTIPENQETLLILNCDQLFANE